MKTKDVYDLTGVQIGFLTMLQNKGEDTLWDMGFTPSEMELIDLVLLYQFYLSIEKVSLMKIRNTYIKFKKQWNIN